MIPSSSHTHGGAPAGEARAGEGLAAPCCCEGAPRPERPSTLRLHATILPVLAVALAPKCPLCVAAYLGVLGSLGGAVWPRIVWGAPLMAAALVVALAAFTWRSPRRLGHGPLWLGASGGAVLLAGKISSEGSMILLPLGAALLLGASIWNTRARRAAVLRHDSIRAAQQMPAPLHDG
jgi:hypothetical protein